MNTNSQLSCLHGLLHRALQVKSLISDTIATNRPTGLIAQPLCIHLVPTNVTDGIRRFRPRRTVILELTSPGVLGTR